MTWFQILHGKEDRWHQTQQLNKAHENEHLHLSIDGGYAYCDQGRIDKHKTPKDAVDLQRD